MSPPAYFQVLVYASTCGFNSHQLHAFMKISEPFISEGFGDFSFVNPFVYNGRITIHFLFKSRIGQEFSGDRCTRKDGTHVICYLQLLCFIGPGVDIQGGRDIWMPQPLLYILDIRTVMDEHARAGCPETVQGQGMVQTFWFEDDLLKTPSDHLYCFPCPKEPSSTCFFPSFYDYWA